MKFPTRQFVYRYNGNPHTQEVMHDRTGMAAHFAGEILHRLGKDWRVAVVQNEYPFAGVSKTFRQHVFLTDNF